MSIPTIIVVAIAMVLCVVGGYCLGRMTGISKEVKTLKTVIEQMKSSEAELRKLAEDLLKEDL